MIFIIKLYNKYFVKWLNKYFMEQLNVYFESDKICILKEGLMDVCIVCIVTTELVGTDLIFIIKLYNKYFMKW